MSLKEKKYEKALNTMLILGSEIIYRYIEEAEDIETCDNALKKYMLTLKEWINDNGKTLDSLPMRIPDNIKKKSYEETRLANIVKDWKKYPNLSSLYKKNKFM